mmetsp:Transcript_34713/g.82801  ORF Transcript_34713/g.82801 Transcript_34713/m.82801 type:complete len:280 (-) Transcript_34713:51-890(-)
MRLRASNAQSQEGNGKRVLNHRLSFMASAGRCLSGCAPPVGCQPSSRPPAQMPALWASSRKMPGASSSSEGAPHCASRPWSRTMMRLLWSTVRRRWAIVRTMLSLTSVCRMRWMRASLVGSTFAVASSRQSTRLCRNSARAKHSTWRSPTEKLEPPSATAAPSPPSMPWTSSSKVHRRRTSQISASSHAPSGSKLRRSSPENRIGSCGTMVMLRRSSRKPTLVMSTPPKQMDPCSRGDRRNRALISVDFPEPVRPTIPTFSHAATRADKLWSTIGRCGK